MKRLAWSEVRSTKQPGLKQELRVLIELLRVLPRPGLPMHVTILPSNIMVGDDGSVLVSAARFDSAPHEERYLAPEVQCGAEPMLPAAIYAVGALLFEAVTGHPFETRDLVNQELAGARAMARAAGLGALFWEIYLLEAAAKATDEQPEKRWTSGKDFAEDLERVARDRIVTRAELGQLVTETLEARASSRPPTRSSGPPDGGARAAPPPLPKKKARRRSSSSKQKPTSAAQQAAAAAQKAANAAPKGPRAAPIPRTDGDAPQMPLITALRVPSNLRLPESGTERTTASRAPTAAPVASAASRAPVAASAAALRSPVPLRTNTPLGLGAVRPPASAAVTAPAAVCAPAAVSAVAPRPALAATTSSAPPPPAAPASEPPPPDSPLPRFESSPPGPSANGAGSTPPPGRSNPVALGPRIEPDPAIPHKAGPSGPPVVVPSLSASSAVVPTDAGGSRRRTLTGTGDLRWLEGLQPPADAMDPNRHGTLVGLGMPSPSARLEPAFSEPEPATTPMRRPSPAPQRSSTPPVGSMTAIVPAGTPPSSSAPPARESLPSSCRLRYVQPATLEPGWDSVAGSESDLRISSSDVDFLPKKSWMGRVLLAVVVLVALGIGTFGVVGHYAVDDDKDSDASASKTAAERSGDPHTRVAARADDSPRSAKADATDQPPTARSENEPEPSVEATEATPAAEADKPDAPAPRSAPVRRAPARPAPARAAAPRTPVAPAAPPAQSPPKGADRDYGI